MIALAFLRGLPRWVWIAVAVAALASALWWIRGDAYRNGVKAERTRFERIIAADKLAQQQRERQADANRAAAQTKASAASTQRTKEIDDATRDIPDQALSARQRATLCVELRRQAKSNGRTIAACGPPDPR